MLRAVAMAARLEFRIDPPIDAAIAAHGAEIARSAPARLIEEIYKLLRAGASEQAFRMLAERRLLEPIAPASCRSGAGEALWRSLAALDAYRRRFEDTPETLTNAVLLGSLLVPLGFDLRSPPVVLGTGGRPRKEPRCRSVCFLSRAATSNDCARFSSLQRRLVDMQLSPRAREALMHRGPFREALTWLEIHGQAPEVLEHWRGSSKRRKRSIRARSPPMHRHLRAGGDDAGDGARTVHRRRRSTSDGYPRVRSNSFMKDTSASTPSSGNAL